MIGRGSLNKVKASSSRIASEQLDAAVKMGLERLEDRRLLSVSVSGGILSISRVNSNANLTITINVDPSDSTQYQVDNNGVIRNFPMAGIDSTNIEVGGGNDMIDVNATFPNLVNNNGLTGGSGNDTILGSPGPDVINGGLGNNSLAGRGGNDNVSAGDNDAGDAAFNDTLTGGAGDDILLGGNGNDVIHGGKGDDQESGGSGADTIVGGAGNDSLFGKAGADLLMGGVGNNFLAGGKGPDTLFGGAGGDNTLTGGKGLDVLAGNNEDNLSLSGSEAVPGTGADSISGGPGADTILASSGLDTVFGGAGPDDFNTVPGDVLTDFTPGSGDYQPSQQVYNGTAVEDITITLNINVMGSAVPLPADAGSFAGGTSIAEVTSVNGDAATIQFSDVTARTFVLGDFFNQFGVSLRPTGLGQFINGNGGTLTMTVNGHNNTLFDAYQVQNGDVITLNYA